MGKLIRPCLPDLFSLAGTPKQLWGGQSPLQRGGKYIYTWNDDSTCTASPCQFAHIQHKMWWQPLEGGATGLVRGVSYPAQMPSDVGNRWLDQCSLWIDLGGRTLANSSRKIIEKYHFSYPLKSSMSMKWTCRICLMTQEMCCKQGTKD